MSISPFAYSSPPWLLRVSTIVRKKKERGKSQENTTIVGQLSRIGSTNHLRDLAGEDGDHTERGNDGAPVIICRYRCTNIRGLGCHAKAREKIDGLATGPNDIGETKTARTRKYNGISGAFPWRCGREKVRKEGEQTVWHIVPSTHYLNQSCCRGNHGLARSSWPGYTGSGKTFFLLTLTGPTDPAGELRHDPTTCHCLTRWTGPGVGIGTVAIQNVHLMGKGCVDLYAATGSCHQPAGRTKPATPNWLSPDATFNLSSRIEWTRAGAKISKVCRCNKYTA